MENTLRLLQDVIHMRLYNFNILWMFSDEVYNLLISHVPCFLPHLWWRVWHAKEQKSKLIHWKWARSQGPLLTGLPGYRYLQPVQMVYQLFADTPKSLLRAELFRLKLKKVNPSSNNVLKQPSSFIPATCGDTVTMPKLAIHAFSASTSYNDLNFHCAM